MNRVTANGLRFAYVEEGEADRPLALLLHGFPDTPSGWSFAMKPLAEAGYRVVAPFMRGYAPTEVPETVATLPHLAEDAVALIEALGHDRAALLVGHDWGAGAAYLAATIAPDRVGKLVAVGVPHPSCVKLSPRLLWVGRHFVGLKLPGAAWRVRRRRFALIDTYYRRWSPTWRFGPEETAAVKSVFSDTDSLAAAIGYYRGSRLGAPIAGFRGRRIAAPCLAVAGRDDPGVPPDMYRQAERKFEGPYAVAVLPGGHFVHRESKDAFVDRLLRFAATD